MTNVSVFYSIELILSDLTNKSGELPTLVHANPDNKNRSTRV